MAGEADGGNAGPIVPFKDLPPMNFPCPSLTPTNYTSWSIKMESILDAQGLWEAVISPNQAAVDIRLVKRARAYIMQSLPENLLLLVASHKTAKAIWDALKTRHLGAERVQQARLQTLNREFELLSMKDTESIEDMASRINEISAKICALGSEIKESIQVKKLLNSVPDKFLPMVASLEQYADLEIMPFEEAIGRLKAFEERLKPRDQSKNQSSQLLLARNDTRGSRGRGSTGRNRGRGRGRTQNGGRSRNPGGDEARKQEKDDRENVKRDKKNVRCYNCDKYGHYASECRAPKK